LAICNTHFVDRVDVELDVDAMLGKGWQVQKRKAVAGGEGQPQRDGKAAKGSAKARHPSAGPATPRAVAAKPALGVTGGGTQRTSRTRAEKDRAWAAKLVISEVPKPEWFKGKGFPDKVEKEGRFLKHVAGVVNIVQGRGSQVREALVLARLVPETQQMRIPARCNSRINWCGLYVECEILSKLVYPISKLAFSSRVARDYPALRSVRTSVRKALSSRGIRTKAQLFLLGDYIEVIADFGRQIVIPTFGRLGHTAFPGQAFVAITVFRHLAAHYIQ
jgi:hypothetical protein